MDAAANGATATSDLVLLPGLDGTDALFRPLVQALPAHLRPRVVPFPTDVANDYAALTRHVRTRIKDIHRPVILAWSFAGPIGIRLAADDGVAPRALILAASFARNPHPMVGGLAMLATPWLMAALRRVTPAWPLLGRHATEETRALLREAHVALTGRLLGERIRSILSVDDSDLLAAVRVPILYLQSDRDRVVTRASARHVCAANPRTSVVTLAGAHLALATNPNAAVAAVESFLSSP